jgi:acyl-[acyl carrier protein]--UDP-N-acetylglucosamine O-acyltransferase
LRRAYKVLYRNNLTIANALEELRKIGTEEINQLVAFIEGATAGIVR